MRPSLLLVDDDIPSREMLGACLAKQGFDVAGAENATEARQRLEATHFDLVLLDINLPGIDGLSLARELRLASDIGIILLTSRDGQMDRVLGLEWGADDYVTKDTPLAELIARIRALLRRTGRNAQKAEAPVPAEAPICFDGWSLSLDTGCLLSPAGEEVKLTRGEFDLLAVLAKNLGKVVARADLLAVLSSREWSGTERSVDVLVSRLRRKLGDDPRHPRRLMTVHGTGYRLAD
jgi:DNA-binding response OmpR family regulator